MHSLTRSDIERHAYGILCEAYREAGYSEQYASDLADCVLDMNDRGEDREDWAMNALYPGCPSEIDPEHARLIHRAIALLDLALGLEVLDSQF